MSAASADTPDANICGSDWLIAWRSVSVSFVYRLITSPCSCVSKYEIGSVCMCSNISSRICFMTPCSTPTSRYEYSHALNVPSA